MSSKEKATKLSGEERWDRFKELAAERHVSEDHQLWDNVYYVTKIVFSVFLLLVILGCAVVSKGALLLLTWNLYTPSIPGGNRLKTLDGHLNYTGNETGLIVDSVTETNVYYIWALFMLVATPYFLSALFFFMRLVFKGRQKFKLKALLFVLFTSTVHVVGLSIMVFSLLPTLDPFAGLLYCSSVTFMPSVLQSVFYGKRRGPKNVAFFILTLLSIVFLVTSLIFWTLYVGLAAQPAIAADQIALFAICPILVSFGWVENFLPNARIEAKSEHETHDTSEENTGKKEECKDEEKKIRVVDFTYNLTRDIYKSRYIVFLVVNVWKILVMFLMILAIFGEGCDQGKCIETLLGRGNNTLAHMTSRAFGRTWLYYGTACHLRTPFVIAVIGMAASFVSNRLCVAAVKIVAQIFSFYIPLILTTPATLGTAIIIVAHLKDTAMCSFPFPWWERDLDIEYWWLGLLGAVFGYLSIIFATTFLWTNNIRRMEREDKLFFKPLYSGALFDQSMLLRRQRVFKIPKADEKTDAQDDVVNEYDIPLLYLCATMWHETESEMTQILTSLFRMDIDQCVRSLTHAYDGDYYRFEAHILFDDAFQPGSSYAGEYVELFTSVIHKAASDFYPKKFPLQPPTKFVTPYGGRLEYILPGENPLIVHLKDKSKIRNKKRWSQVMYMYYFLAHKMDEEVKVDDPKLLERRAQNTFILALDGDVDFRPQAVKLLVDRMKRNPLIGAACGRIHPIGGGPMVWYQKFEYAVSHWLIKATEHVTGCVLCSPGCFSLFRGSALMEVNVMKKYTTMPSKARHHVQYDQGEDRWLCTLLLKQGKKIDYCAASDAYTFAPEGFKEFFKQRRRWTPSTMANIMEILEDWKTITQKNNNMSLPYIVLQTFWFFSSVLTPGVLFLMIVGAISLAYPALSITASLLINLGVLFLYVLTCFFAKEKHQLNFAAALSVAYAIVMMIVLVGLIRQSAEQGICSITPIFSIFVVGVFVIAGLSHPKEFGCLLYGPLFFIAIPAMSMLLLIYSIINLNNVSWGTREAPKPPVQAQAQEPTSGPRSTAQTILDKLRLSCQCCTGSSKSSQQETALAVTLNEIKARLSNIEESVQPQLRKKRELEAWTSVETPRVFPERKKEKTSEAPKGHINFEDGENLSDEEHRFWRWLIDTYLYPLNVKKEDPETGKSSVEHQVDMKNELRVFRNKASLAFLLLNALFITIIFFLQIANADTNGRISFRITCPNGQLLLIEPISVSFTVMFGILLAVSFICMLVHRWKTFLQINSIISFKREVSIEQLLMDSFDDIVGSTLKKEAKQYDFTSSFARSSRSFKKWLYKKLCKMAEIVIKEEELRSGAQARTETPTAVRAFRQRVRKVKHIHTLNSQLKRMKTQEVKSLKDCIERARKYYSKPQKPGPRMGEAAMVLMKREKEGLDKVKEVPEYEDDLHDVSAYKEDNSVSKADETEVKKLNGGHETANGDSKGKMPKLFKQASAKVSPGLEQEPEIETEETEPKEENSDVLS